MLLSLVLLTLVAALPQGQAPKPKSTPKANSQAKAKPQAQAKAKDPLPITATRVNGKWVIKQGNQVKVTKSPSSATSAKMLSKDEFAKRLGFVSTSNNDPLRSKLGGDTYVVPTGSANVIPSQSKPSEDLNRLYSSYLEKPSSWTAQLYAF